MTATAKRLSESRLSASFLAFQRCAGFELLYFLKGTSFGVVVTGCTQMHGKRDKLPQPHSCVHMCGLFHSEQTVSPFKSFHWRAANSTIGQSIPEQHNTFSFKQFSLVPNMQANWKESLASIPVGPFTALQVASRLLCVYVPLSRNPGLCGQLLARHPATILAACSP